MLNLPVAITSRYARVMTSNQAPETIEKAALSAALHLILNRDDGGARRSRTALAGFAIQCITDLLSRRFPNKKGQHF